MKRIRSWYLDDAVQLMRAYIWCYQVSFVTTTVTSEEFADWLWSRALRSLSYSQDWHADFDRTIKRAVERAYIEFYAPLQLPPRFRTLTDEILSDISGFFAPKAA